MAAKKAKSAKKGGGAKVNLVVGSKVKDTVRSAGVRSAGDLVDALNDKVLELLKGAVGRCKANGRGTVRPQDL
jgi:histone H3/H4